MVSAMTEECWAGVYVIRNVVTEQVYVGASIRLGYRWREHQWGGGRSTYMVQKSWIECGEDCMRFEVLEHVEDVSHLKEREQYWIDELDARCPKHGLNKRNPIPRPWKPCSRCAKEQAA
jgi:group I intron endonuclease